MSKLPPLMIQKPIRPPLADERGIALSKLQVIVVSETEDESYLSRAIQTVIRLTLQDEKVPKTA